MWKQSHHRTALRNWEPWRTQEREAEWLAPTITHLIHGASDCWGWQLLEDMAPLRTDFETHAIWQGYTEDPAAKAFVARKAHLIALSKAWGTQQSTLFTSLEIPWEFHTQAVLRSLVGLMSREKVSVQGFLWVRKVWFAFVQQTVAPETFGKRQKGENSLVVSLLPGSHERLALRNPHVPCQKHGGACTTYQLELPRLQETGWEIGFPCSQERRKEISK